MSVRAWSPGVGLTKCHITPILPLLVTTGSLTHPTLWQPGPHSGSAWLTQDTKRWLGTGIQWHCLGCEGTHRTPTQPFHGTQTRRQPPPRPESSPEPGSKLDNNFTPSHDSNWAQLSNSTPNLVFLTFVYLNNCLPNLRFLHVLNRNKNWWIFKDCPGQMIGKTFFNFVEMLLFIRPTGLAILRNAGGPMRIDLIVLWLGEDYISPPPAGCSSASPQSWPEPEMSSPSYAGAEERERSQDAKLDTTTQMRAMQCATIFSPLPNKLIKQ